MSTFELVIKPRTGWQPINFREVFLYRELLGFLVWRDIKLRYRQTVLGSLWAVLQPIAAMTIFNLVFNRLAGVRSDGPPYPLFAFAGLTAWTFFSNSVSQSATSLVTNQQLVAKIYFPRIFIPIGCVGALLLDMALSLLMLGGMMLYYHWPLSPQIAFLPIFVLGTFLAATGLGLSLSSLNVLFRDIKYALPFMVQMGIFLTPVIYPVNYIPGRWQWLAALNPMAGMVQGFRYSILGTPASWQFLGISLAISAALFVTGLLVFTRLERRFADII